MEKCQYNITEKVSAVLGPEKYIIIYQAEGTHGQRDKEMKRAGRVQYNRSEAMGVICLGEENSQVSEMRVERLRAEATEALLCTAKQFGLLPREITEGL